MSFTQIHTLNDEQKAETSQRKKTLIQIYIRLNDELEKRDLSEVPTEKLIQLIVQLNRQADNQNVLINEKKFEKGL